jgi:hypothetical protein
MLAGFAVHELIRNDYIAPSHLSDQLRITLGELSATLGISRDAVTKTARLHSKATQGRLRELVEILNRVEPWAGSLLGAYAWYRSQGLPSFGDATAETLVREGRAEDLRAYLDRIAAGGFA